MRYYANENLNEISREQFEECLLETIKAGKQFTLKGIAKDAFMLSVGEIMCDTVTEEQAGRLYANVIHQLDSAICRTT